MKPCNFIGCSELVVSGYCKDHNQHEHYDRYRRDKDEHAFYSSNEWRKLRAYKRKITPCCEQCEREGIVIMADVVHHKVEIKKDWNLRLKLYNLESLCNSCHEKTKHRGG
jgi:5-methylcytosine-specific restriction enzyme A